MEGGEVRSGEDSGVATCICLTDGSAARYVHITEIKSPLWKRGEITRWGLQEKIIETRTEDDDAHGVLSESKTTAIT